MSSHQWHPSAQDGTLERLLGDSERAFVRGSNGGVGDMFLHLDFIVGKEEMMDRERVYLAWGMLRVLHPLLMCAVEVEGNDFDNAKFSFKVPRTLQDLIANANSALSYETHSREELIDRHMNGPRTHISNAHLSHLTISSSEAKYHIVMTGPHFTGDGTSLHQSTHDLLAILSSGKSNTDIKAELEALFTNASPSWSTLLPLPVEARLPLPTSRFARAATKVNFLQSRQREVGDHTLPRLPADPSRPLHTKFVEHTFTEEQSKDVLKKCKQHGVSINNMLIAICGASWSKLKEKERVAKNAERNLLPLMLYTAINLRPFLTPPSSVPTSIPPTYWFLPLTYYTLSLPSYPPSSDTIWHRARLAKSQTSRAVKSPFLTGRARIMAAQRNGSDIPSSSPFALAKNATLPEHSRSFSEPTPSKALLGVSLIGNLDNTYVRSEYSAASSAQGYAVTLHSVTTASKLKPGGLLLLAHTFGGRLWVQLFWDVNGFQEGVIESWWDGVVAGIGEL
ncbi:hypothetical protein M422DRAFT_29494 [Sphaerobolus stellatus SS14]|uniref:Uncharacterized protein n=1 Tax=Sphaerobolus stellatus (strain SS14) TaxID=990650 RepID=A0A0C9UTE3_SPHS4|nr:hypothetical protein M422DRAFT_29494 [Sphaerobolus stellatus SS14]